MPIFTTLCWANKRTRVTTDADRAAGHHALAESRERLLEATTQTVLAAAGAEQPAVAARWWVAVPYSPRVENARDQLRSLAARSRGRTLWSAHREAAIESARVTMQIEAALRESGGQVSGTFGAAAKLGIHRSTLESKIVSLKIDKYRFKTPKASKNT